MSERTELELLQIAEAGCRAAWAAAPQAIIAHLCHDNIHLEYLTEPAECRINYIRAWKPRDEQVARLTWFRPWLGEIPAAWLEARQALVGAYQAWGEAYQNLAEADDRAKKNAYTAWQQARWICWEVECAWLETPEFQAEHARLFPGCPWNGKSLFPRVLREGG